MNFVRHEDLEVPPGNAIVWRYMSLEKFLDLVTHKRLFFTNATNLTDKHEVTIPPNVLESRRKILKEEGLDGRDLEEEIAAYEYFHSPMRELTLVNCWSLGREESFALWKIYLGGSRAGVAIRTSLSRLQKSIALGGGSYPEDIYVSKVKYRKFLPEREVSRFNLICTKREFYEYEKELRLFILHFPTSEGGTKPPYPLRIGRYVDVDLDIMIENLYISPFVAPWFGDAIRKVLAQIAPFLMSRIVQSGIQDM